MIQFCCYIKDKFSLSSIQLCITVQKNIHKCKNKRIKNDNTFRSPNVISALCDPDL